MRKQWLFIVSLAALPALAQDAPTPAQTAPAGQGATRTGPAFVEASMPLPRIDVHVAKRIHEEAAARVPEVKAAPETEIEPVTTRTMTYDVPEQRVVNPTRSFRFIALTEQDQTSVVSPETSDN